MRDERLVVGFLAFHLLIAAPGFLALYALGFLRAGPLSFLAAAGPAFVLGVILTGVPLIALLVAGVPVGATASLAMLAAVTVVTGLAAARVYRRSERATGRGGAGPRASLAERAVERLVLGLTAVYLALGSLGFTHLHTLWTTQTSGP